MYTRTAALYDALYHFQDYAKAAGRLRSLIAAHRRPSRSLLDVGCGTGSHLSLLAGEFEVAGLDINPELLAVAAAKCPQARLHLGDMRDFDLGRRFDVVTCLFAAIAYVRDTAGLRGAIGSFARHLAPGGFLVVEPWFTPDRYWLHHLKMNVADRPEMKIAWMYSQERQGDVAVFDIHYLVGEPGSVRHYEERHELGLFTEDDFAAAFGAAGLKASLARPGLFGEAVYLASAADDGAGSAG